MAEKRRLPSNFDEKADLIFEPAKIGEKAKAEPDDSEPESNGEADPNFANNGE
ncbi:MAG: hypothetical protein JWL66_1568 [Sphingomonadales bacterium]|nr:hypothetical protein [Sphingomonadales bacterium]